ncbi:unnamed protein product, partial [Medioppia subpectinata]
MVDILINIMIEKMGFDEKESRCLYIFIVKLLSDKRNTVHIKKTLLDEMIENLFVSEDKQSFEERERVLLELLQSETGHGLHGLDETQFLRLALNANLLSHVFDYINQIVMSANVSVEEKKVFIETIYSNIEVIIEIDF